MFRQEDFMDYLDENKVVYWLAYRSAIEVDCRLRSGLDGLVVKLQITDGEDRRSNRMVVSHFGRLDNLVEVVFMGRADLWTVDELVFMVEQFGVKG